MDFVWKFEAKDLFGDFHQPAAPKNLGVLTPELAPFVLKLIYIYFELFMASSVWCESQS